MPLVMLALSDLMLLADRGHLFALELLKHDHGFRFAPHLRIFTTDHP